LSDQKVRAGLWTVPFRPGPRRSWLLVLLLALAGAPSLPAAAPSGKTFNLLVACHDLDSFDRMADLAVRLKPYGRVQINISTLPDKCWYTIPEGGSAWHEYAAYNPTFFRFYPHPKVAPFIPAETVAADRKFLLEKAAVVRRLGLEASFWCYGVNFLPEAFFGKYPYLRGPRVDHPRRSRQEEFALCVDLEETRAMYEWSVAELKRNVPELSMILFKTNDAGGGLCWAAAQYAGPNGPRFCRSRSVGARLRDYCLALHRGASAGGGDVTLRIASSNFWQNEEDVLFPLLPPDTFYDRRDPGEITVSAASGETYPVMGLVSPLAVISAMERYDDPSVQRVDLPCRIAYDRGNETPEALAKVIDLMEDCIAEPAHGMTARQAKLRKFAARWGGEPNAEALYEAFNLVDQALQLKQTAAPQYNPLNCAVSVRYLNRPLVIKPEFLKPGEEAYFLPFVFNIRENEARQDYIDLHGGRLSSPVSWNDPGLGEALGMALQAASIMEGLKDAPEAAWLGRQALALRLWASEVRSINNFHHAQLIRDKYAAILAGPPRIPAKKANWDGDPGNLEWNEIMRDEFDNANELVALLESGGLDLIARAADQRHEDTFILGPDLLNQVKLKTKIMREHWLDVQDYLAPPHK
jgi:hypothetical protein